MSEGTVAEDGPVASARLFIGIELADELKSRIGEAIAQASAPSNGATRRDDVRWVAPRKLHLTLKFLGATPRERVPEILSALDQAARVHAAGHEGALTLALEEPGAFPGLRRPRVLWLGIAQPGAWLTRLALALDGALSELGFEPETREFAPHLTLARIRPGSRARLEEPALAPFRGLKGSEIPVRELVLFESRSAPVSDYVALGRVALTASRTAFRSSSPSS